MFFNLGQILVESSLLLPARHGEDGGLGLAALFRESQHRCQCVVVGGWKIKSLILIDMKKYVFTEINQNV